MGVKVAAFFGSSGRIFWNNVREVNTLADFQGIKSRAPENPINIAELEALGCIPTPMAWNELYTGLQQGTVDGLVSSKMPIIQQGLIDVLKYATDTNHSYSINVILISSAKYNSFSEEQRAAYDKAIAGAAEEEWKIAMKEEEDSVQKIKELQEQGKILYTELTDEASLELGNYKGLTLTAVKAGVTDEDLEAELENLKGQYPAEVTGRAAKLGDVANIDYVGTKDGEAFSGGTAEGFDLALGSGTFIDGFEDGVVGMNVGEEKDLNLTFPENYKSADLAGQEVVFHVTLNAVKNAEETAIDDALAKRAMDDENATLDQLRSQVYGGLENQAESNFFNEAGSELLNQAIENSKVTRRCGRYV